MSANASKPTIYYPPVDSPDSLPPSVILYGTIEGSGLPSWRNQIIADLHDLPVAVLNPFRSDWDSSWFEDISCPKFKEQVEWEMNHAQKADVIVFYFGADTLAPITLLELGLYAATGKAIVCCPPEFEKKGNVQIVCEKYNIPIHSDLQPFCHEIRTKLEKLLVRER